MKQLKYLKHLSRWGFLLYLLIVNALMILLYHKFIVGNGIYLYTDVGSDVYTSSFPIISMLARLFQNGSFPQYELTAGTGNAIAVTYLQYINPIKTFLLLLDHNTLPLGILIYLFLQTNVTAIAAYFFFRAYLKNAAEALIPALLWTFSGFTVLWTQNLSFGVCISMFTLTMLALQYHLSHEQFRSFLLLSGVLSLFLLTNYFFYYMAGVFTVCYVIGYGLTHASPLRKIIKMLFELFFAAVLSFLLCAADIAAILAVFFGSTRATEAGAALRPGFLFPGKDILTMIGRLLSPNLFGAGYAYSAASNYYEAACLFSGTLFLFAISYLILNRSTRKRSIILLAASALLLSTPLTGRILTANYTSQRYVYLAVFLECLAAADFVHALFSEYNPAVLKRSIVLGAILMILLMGLVIVLSPIHGFVIDQRAMIFCILSFVLYTVLLLLFVIPCGFIRKLLPLLLTGAVCAELFLSNYDSINYRSYVTDDVYEYALYHDGTQDAVEDIRQQDSDLYRISGDSNLSFANSGMVNDYNGVAGYSSTLPKSLIQLSSQFSDYQLSRNYFLLDYSDYVTFTLFGGRYLIDDGFHPIANGMEPSLFEQIDRIYTPEHGIDKRVFRNRHALPFGYLYTSSVDTDDALSRNANDRMHLLTSAYYETNGADQTVTPSEVPQESAHTDSVAPLLPLLTETVNTTVTEGENGLIYLTQTESGSNLFFAIDPERGTDTIQYLHMTLENPAAVGEATFTVYPLTKSEPIAKSDYSNHFVLNQQYPEANILLPDQLIGLRIDLEQPAETVLSALELITCTGIQQNLDRLAKTDISDISFADSTYSAVVRSENGGMLCVPLIYADEWTAEVNGKAAEVHNINGGFVGIPLSGGEEHVTIRYSIPHFKAGIIVSLISLLGYLLLWIYSLVSERARRHNKNRSVS